MGVISFLPIQPGEGSPSPVNVRPIYAPLNIDGIGEVWGGKLDINAGELIVTFVSGVISEWFYQASVKSFYRGYIIPGMS